MPATIIPEEENSFEATAHIGNNGLGANVLFATKQLFVIDVAAQVSSIMTESRGYDVGLGKAWKQESGKSMLLLTAGYGKYTAKPYTLGATGQIYEIDSDAYRVGVYFNKARQKWGMIHRLSYYWGRSQWERISAPSTPKHTYAAIAYEPAFYCLFGKRKHIVFILGGSISRNSGNSNSSIYEEGTRDLLPSPLYVSLGLNLADDK